MRRINPIAILVIGGLLATSLAAQVRPHTHRPKVHQHYRQQNEVQRQQRQRRIRANFRERIEFRSDVVPTDDIVMEYGDDWKFDCRVKPLEQIKEVKWFKDGLPWERVVRHLYKHRFRKKAQLFKLFHLTSKDVGYYECVVHSLTGQTLRRKFQISEIVPRVLGAPPVISPGQPGNHTVLVGSDLTLKCGVSYIDSSDVISMNWTYTSGNKVSTVQSCGMNSICGYRSEDVLENPGQLELTNVQLNQTGWYNCTAYNTNGQITHSGFVDVLTALPKDVAFNRIMAFVSGGAAAGVVVCLVIVTIAMIRYRRERRQRLEAFENARSVISWTKRVIILADNRNSESGVDEEQNNLISSRVVIKRERADHAYHPCSLAGSEKSGDFVCPEYNFDIDPNWEIDYVHLRPAGVLGEGEFGRVIKAQLCNGVGAGTYMESNGGCLNGHRTKDRPYSVIFGKNTSSQSEAENEFRSVTVAIKMLKEGHTDSDMKDLVMEMIMMKEIGRHENIINLLGTCVTPNSTPLYVIVEYAEHGNLKEYLKNRRPSDYNCEYESPIFDQNQEASHCGSSLTLKDLLNMGWQIAKGMEYLTLKKCVHRDLAARNVLVCDHGIYKISDFGMARGVHEKEYYRKLTCGKVPLRWMAPECIFDRVYSPQSDVWSFGITLWEILTFGEDPYKNMPVESLPNLLKQGTVMSRPYRCPEQVYDLMKNCWNLQPENRPQWHQIISSIRSFHTEGYLPMLSGNLAERNSSGYSSS